MPSAECQRRFHPQEQASDDDLRRMAAAAWHKQGVLMIRVDEVANWADRAFFAAYGERVHGKRGATDGR